MQKRFLKWQKVALTPQLSKLYSKYAKDVSVQREVVTKVYPICESSA